MDNSNIHKITTKFLNREANEKDLEHLEASLKDPNNVKLFNRLVRIEYLTSLCMKNFDLAKAKESIYNKIKEERKKRRVKYYRKISIAASVIILLGIAFNNMFFKVSETEPAEVTKIVESGSNKAILTLSDGKEIALEKGEIYKTDKITSNGEEIFYDNHTSEETKLTYNYLTIPRGGQFFLKLSDGTRVWLNSESKLKYPTIFPTNSPRNVELIYGEAYFEVSPSEKHNGMSFNVSTEYQNLSVLGTEFNIRAYKDERDIITTLAGGKVIIEKGNIKETLMPNQQSIIDADSDTIVVQEVDASVVTAWVKGLFIFEEASLDDMMDDLSRWYDVNVFFESQKLKNIPFTGILERSKSLNTILEIIEESNENEMSFEINDKALIIK